MSPTAARPGRALIVVASAAGTAVLLLAAVLLSSGRSSAGTAGPPAPADDSVAVGFARDMSVHHQQAVEMSFLVLANGSSPDVRSLAYDIANTQAAQRGMMLGWLSLWGRTATSDRAPMAWMHMPPPGAQDRHEGVLMPGMASRADLTALGRARGPGADRLFLRLMIEHHRGGLHMASGVLGQGAPAVTEQLARGMVASQQAEIDLMESLLASQDAKTSATGGLRPPAPRT